MTQVLKSLSPAYGGYTIAREDRVILIKGAIPGETVEVEISEKKRDYSIARVVNVVEPSEFRVAAICPVFGLCGGCQLQFISYEKQLSMKDEILSDSLSRLGGVETPLGPPVCGAALNYRRRAQFKVSKNGEAGFFRESSRDVVSFDSCPLMDDSINGVFSAIRKNLDLANLTEIHIASGDCVVALLKGKDYRPAPLEKYLELGISGAAFLEGPSIGAEFTSFDLDGLKYTVSPGAFFQAHWALNTEVVRLMTEGIMPLEGKSVLDLYAGAGNFSLPAAVHAKEVTAVEENAFAVEDGTRNASVNGIKNCRFVKSGAEKFKFGKKFDVLILDPPRPGLTKEAAAKVLADPPEKIAYLSCNPATFARDLKKFREKYDVVSVRQIDFFPNTFHIEALAILQLR